MVFPTFLLTLGFVDDLLTKKVHNVLSLGLILGAAIYSLIQDQLLAGALGALAAFALLFPLFAFRVLGAGDVKVMMAFGLTTSAEIVLKVLVFGTIWAAVFGVTKLVVSGNLLDLLRQASRPDPESLKIPMTFPLLLGWMSVLHMEGLGL